MFFEFSIVLWLFGASQWPLITFPAIPTGCRSWGMGGRQWRDSRRTVATHSWNGCENRQLRAGTATGPVCSAEWCWESLQKCPWRSSSSFNCMMNRGTTWAVTRCDHLTSDVCLVYNCFFVGYCQVMSGLSITCIYLHVNLEISPDNRDSNSPIWFWRIPTWSSSWQWRNWTCWSTWNPRYNLSCVCFAA